MWCGEYGERPTTFDGAEAKLFRRGLAALILRLETGDAGPPVIAFQSLSLTQKLGTLLEISRALLLEDQRPMGNTLVHHAAMVAVCDTIDDYVTAEARWDGPDREWRKHVAAAHRQRWGKRMVSTNTNVDYWRGEIWIMRSRLVRDRWGCDWIRDHDRWLLDRLLDDGWSFWIPEILRQHELPEDYFPDDYFWQVAPDPTDRLMEQVRAELKQLMRGEPVPVHND